MSYISGYLAIGVGLVVVVTPIGLGLKGRTSKLGLTRRLKTVLALFGVIFLGLELCGFWFLPKDIFPVISCALAILVPGLIDLALALDRPIELALSKRYQIRAEKKLRAISPKIVAVTGSYGKTSTKNYLVHLLGSRFQVYGTPHSYNNANGIARAINEGLSVGTEVFIVEMGTYGPGEIAKMCSWVCPDISVITAIGPVHLERMKSQDNILKAKAEICNRASIVVLNGQDDRLLKLGVTLQEQGKTVVLAGPGDLTGLDIPLSAARSNVACAIGVARQLGVSNEELSQLIPRLPEVKNRRATYGAEAGFSVVDDTYNSNPTGAKDALEFAKSLVTSGRSLMVVTPGMVELGKDQDSLNAQFAAQCGLAGARLIVVGKTNRQALIEGWPGKAGAGSLTEMGHGLARRFSFLAKVDLPEDGRVQWAKTRDQAVELVREQLGPGDVVLYENDLPDHFP